MGADLNLPFIGTSGKDAVLSVVVKPKARRNSVEGISPEGLLKVCVTDPPVKGAANKGLVKVLSRSMGLPKSAFSIIAGQTATRKKLLILDTTPETVIQWYKKMFPG